MTRRRSRPDHVVEVVALEADDDAPLEPPAPEPRRSRRLRHPWRWATAVLVVAALVVAVTGWQRLGRDVDVVDAGAGWTDGSTLTCSEGALDVAHLVAPYRSAAEERAHVDDDPHDIVTLTNRGDRTITLRLADEGRGAFQPHAVTGSDPDAPAPAPTPVRTVGQVRVPPGASARLRLVLPDVTPDDARGGTGVVWLTSLRLEVTALGVTTTHEVPLAARIVVRSVTASGTPTRDSGTGTPWSFSDDLC